VRWLIGLGETRAPLPPAASRRVPSPRERRDLSQELPTRRLVAIGIVAALVVVLVASALPASAAEQRFPHRMNCGFSDTPLYDDATAWDTEVIIDAPDSVAPGEAFQITVDSEPMVNGPVNSYAEQAEWSARASISGVAEAGDEVFSNTWLNPEQIDAAQEYDMGELVFDLTAGDSGEVEFELTGVYILALGRINVWCFAFDDAGEPQTQSLTIPISGTASGGGAATTTSTTAPADTTTTTAPEQTTTTTVGSGEPLLARQVSASGEVAYQCTTTVGGEEVASEDITQTVTLSAPDVANSGQSLLVGMQVSPGPPNQGDTVQPGTLQLDGVIVVEEGGSAADVGGTVSGNAAAIAPGQPLRAGAIRGTHTVDGGGSVDYRPGAFAYAVDVNDMTVECVPDAAAVLLSTDVVEDEVDQSSAEELPFTGWEEPHVKLIWGALAIYFGYLVVSAMPRVKRKRA
jgi:hypothetical protein